MPMPIPGNIQVLRTAVVPAILNQLYLRKTEDLLFPRLSTELTVGTETAFFPWMGKMPKMRLWTGARQVNMPALETYQVTVQPWENTYGIDVYALADTGGGAYDRMMVDFAESAAWNPEWQLRDLVQGTGVQTGTRQIGTDGVTHWNASHPVDIYNAGAGTFCNDFGTAGVSLGSPSATVGGYLSQTTLSSVCAYVQTIKAQDGERLGVTPTDLMVPVQLEYLAKSLLQTQYLAPQTLGSAYGTITTVGTSDNVLSKMGLNLIVNRNLTNTKGWYLFDLSKAAKPFFRVMRQAPQFVTRQNPDDPAVFDQRTFLYGVDSRECPAFGPPFLSFRSGI